MHASPSTSPGAVRTGSTPQASASVMACTHLRHRVAARRQHLITRGFGYHRSDHVSTSALTRMLVELNRAVPRVNLRALADGVLAGGPSTVPPEELGPAQLRDEVATLSTFFIVELWSYLARFLDGIGVTLATPSRTGDGFAPLAELSLIHISEPTRLLSISYA